MIMAFNSIVLIFVVIAAVAALQVKDLMGAAILLGAYSFMMCIIWTSMGAVDVAFTEAAVGAGVSTVFFLATAINTTRKTKD